MLHNTRRVYERKLTVAVTKEGEFVQRVMKLKNTFIIQLDPSYKAGVEGGGAASFLAF
jgi:hypothetical protein